ncbi:hypothetical protein ACVBKF_23405, partial [Shewanella sp. 0m-11]
TRPRGGTTKPSRGCAKAQKIWLSCLLVLHNAPHTLADIMDPAFDERPYTREEAVFPTAAVKLNKFWPTVNRIDDVFGDRNLMCSCAPISDYE